MKSCIAYYDNFRNSRYLLMSLESLRRVYSGDVFVLTDIMPTDQVHEKLEPFDVKLIECRQQFLDMFQNPEILQLQDSIFTLLTFFRFLIPFLPEFRQYDKVLYLDSDTIVFSGFSKAFDINFSSSYCMFYDPVHNSVHSKLNRKHVTTRSTLLVVHQMRELGLKSTYENAGVLLFNMNHILASDEW